MLLLYATLFILPEAIFEGRLSLTQSSFRDFIFKGWVQFVLAVLLFAIWYLLIARNFDRYYVPDWQLICGYIFLRFGVFDLTYNLFAKKPWNYYGDKKWYDKVMVWFGGFGWFCKFTMFLPMGICFLLGISV